MERGCPQNPSKVARIFQAKPPFSKSSQAQKPRSKVPTSRKRPNRRSNLLVREGKLSNLVFALHIRACCYLQFTILDRIKGPGFGPRSCSSFANICCRFILKRLSARRIEGPGVRYQALSFILLTYFCRYSIPDRRRHLLWIEASQASRIMLFFICCLFPSFFLYLF